MRGEVEGQSKRRPCQGDRKCRADRYVGTDGSTSRVYSLFRCAADVQAESEMMISSGIEIVEQLEPSDDETAWSVTGRDRPSGMPHSDNPA